MTRPRGRPKSDVETGVITVRLPTAMIAHLDRSIDLLAPQPGVKPNRNTVVRHMLERALTAPLAPVPAEVLPADSAPGRAMDDGRQGQWTQGIHGRCRALRTRSQALCHKVQRLYADSHAVRARSQQLRAAQTLRARRHTESRHGPTAGDAYDGTALSDNFTG